MRLLWALAAAGLASAARQRFAAADLSNQLIPRYLVDPGVPMGKRDGGCASNEHSCLDIGHGDICCGNDRYCFVDKEGSPRCCAIGSNCASANQCNSSAYFCTTTSVVSGTTQTQTGCCPRRCASSTSLFLCPQNVGGNCCRYGEQCAEGGLCRATVTESTSSARLTAIDPSCTTSQHRCKDGWEGCCDNDQHCTVVSQTGYCAPGGPAQTEGIEYIDSSPGGDGLSDGAKAGIAVGVVVVAGIVIGLVTWFCIRRRRERAATATLVQGDGHTDLASMAEPTPSAVRPGAAPNDYFGPAQVAGPFTQAAATSHGSSPYLNRAVPSIPQQPGDIAAPVEMDSCSTTTRHTSVAGTPGTPGSRSPGHGSGYGPGPGGMESIQGRFELYGSESAVGHDRPPSIAPTPDEMKTGYFEQKPPAK